MDDEMMGWRNVLPPSPLKMTWQDWQRLLNKLSPQELQHYWPDVRRDMIPEYTRLRLTGQDRNDPYAGLGNNYRPAANQLPEPGAQNQSFVGNFEQGYRVPDVERLFAIDRASADYTSAQPIPSPDRSTMLKSIPDSAGSIDGKHKERLTGVEDIDRETMSQGEWAWRQLKAISVAGRLAGYTHAADNLDHFLDNTGETISFDEEWLRSQEPVQEAEAQTTKILKLQLEIYLQDFMNGDQFEFEISEDAPIEPERDTDFFFAAGGSTLVSQLNASGNIDINGWVVANCIITHYYEDEYDWEEGLSTDLLPSQPGTVVVGDDLGNKAVAAGLASEFWIENNWSEEFSYEFQNVKDPY